MSKMAQSEIQEEQDKLLKVEMELEIQSNGELYISDNTLEFLDSIMYKYGKTYLSDQEVYYISFNEELGYNENKRTIWAEVQDKPVYVKGNIISVELHFEDKEGKQRPLKCVITQY